MIPPNMQAYRLLTGKDDAEFCHKVTAALNKGWMLYGSPTVSVNPSTGETVCAQAVTKEIDGKVYDPTVKLGEL